MVLEEREERVYEKDTKPIDVEPIVENKHVTAETNQERIPPLYPIGQMHGTYILAQNEMVCILLTNMRHKSGSNTNISVKISNRYK